MATKARALAQKLTLEEKCALLTGKNHWQSRDYAHHGIRSLYFFDGPHGVRKQLGEADHLGLNASQPATCFPTAATMACSWDRELCERLGAALGAEAVAQGVDVLLGPGLNIKRSPQCGRNFEYFSEDPYLAGKLAAAYVRGIQASGTAACPKHFAANSQETVRMSSDSVLDERTLREIYLTAFEIVVKEANPRTIMSSYNRVGGTYAHENTRLLLDILRGEWGFGGMVVSDWGGANDAVETARGGGTLTMPGGGFGAARQLAAAVRSGQLPEAALDDRVAEILTEALREKQPAPAVDEGEQHALARSFAEQSIVLLKNEGGILPLQAAQRVAVVGDIAKIPRYQGAGSSFVNTTRLDIPLDCLQTSGLDIVGYAKGYQRLGQSDGALQAEAVALAARADVLLLYLGLTEASEVEGMDRETLSLPQNQLALLAALATTGKPVVAVLAAGSAVCTEWVRHCAAVLHGHLGGQAGAGAIVRVLTGAVCPSGKLAETYPLALGETPTGASFPSREATAEYREGLYVGYRYYEKAGRAVAYPFGYGLSYTSFAYSGLAIAADAVRFTITNTGPVAGAEAAQLYVGRGQGGVFRPVKELKGFAKVKLQPGESQEVTIQLDDKAFRYYNVQTRRWEVEGGEYTVYIGASSADIRLQGSLEVEGTHAPNPYKEAALPAYYSGDIQAVPDAQFATLLGRAIPEKSWPRELHENMPLCRMETAKSPLARLVYRVLCRRQRKCQAKGQPDLNILFIMNIPFRAIAKMTNGMVSDEMVGGMLLMVNGHFFRGVGRAAGGFFRNRRANRQSARLLEAQAKGDM